MSILLLAWKSLLNRRFTVLLTICSIALAVALLLGVERLRHQAHSGFAATISGTDLIVGARTGQIQLLLYSVFRLGEATNNISWQSYRQLADHPRVAWTVPLSLGDSHRGYPVLGTNLDYFTHYRYADSRPLVVEQGRLFEDIFDTVLGAEVARRLGYEMGRELIIAHGAVDVAFVRHAHHPFTVVGILAATGTPVDHTIHIKLAGFESIHLGWQSGVPLPGSEISPEHARHAELTPKSITAFMVGLNSRAATFQFQRYVNQYPREPLLAILPGVTLQQLWQLVGMAERVLLLISWLVLLVGLLGMVSVQLTNLEGRKREIAILRAVGAGPRHLLLLISGEALLLALVGAALGVALTYGLFWLGAPLIESRFGLFSKIEWPGGREWGYLAIVITAGWLSGLIPALRAYRLGLHSGITMRL